jgi:hypothetical protein
MQQKRQLLAGASLARRVIEASSVSSIEMKFTTG